MHNSRLSGRTREEFVEMMAGLKLPRPRLIDTAVPANQQLGLRVGDSVPHGV
jgi:hypothetical protein